MSISQIYISIVMLFISSVTLASPDYAHCDGPTAQYLECLGKVHSEVDDELNKIYKQLKNKTTDNDTKLLVKAQRMWLVFRESECQFFHPKELNSGSGTYYASQQLVCEIDMNQKRINDLREYLSWSGCGSCRW